MRPGGFPLEDPETFQCSARAGGPHYKMSIVDGLQFGGHAEQSLLCHQSS